MLDAGGTSQDALPQDTAPGVDLGVADAGAPQDAMPAVDLGVVQDASGCDFSTSKAPDRDRVVLVGHPFSPNPGQDGTLIRSLTLTATGGLRNDGVKLDVGTKPVRIEFVPSSDYALVLGADGMLVSIAASSAAQIAIRGRVRLPGAGYQDLRIEPDGKAALAVNFDSTGAAGIQAAYLACDGSLTADLGAFFPTLLPQSIDLVPGTDLIVMLGGQATFTMPPDPNDTRLLSRSSTGGIHLVRAFDIWHDDIDCGRLAVAPDGTTALVPNGSSFSTEGSEVSVLAIDRAMGTITQRTRIMNVPDAREALFSPDGLTALVSQEQPNKIAVLTDRGSGWAVVDTLTGIGLADKMAVVSRGSLSGRVLAAATDPVTTPNITMIQIHGPGMATNLGQFSLGPNSQDIPDSITVAP
jgi:hypothetical protein